jgi:nitrate reductase NapA
MSAGHWMISFDEYKKRHRALHAGFRRHPGQGRCRRADRELQGQAACSWPTPIDPQAQGGDVLDHGLQPAPARHLGQRAGLHALHLLLGKHGLPGNGAFSLTGQPSACGTAREVGTFCAPPARRHGGGQPAHRAKAEKIWPAGQDHQPQDRFLHVAKMMRGLEDSSLKWACGSRSTTPGRASPNANHWIRAAREKDNFIVVSDVYPTISGKVADLILPAAYMLEKWGPTATPNAAPRPGASRWTRRAKHAPTCG